MGFVITSLFFAACSINASYWQEEEEISLVFPQTNLPHAAVCLLRSGWHPTFLGIPELLSKTLGRFFFFQKFIVGHCGFHSVKVTIILAIQE